MKLAVLTSNSYRHRYVANLLAEQAQESLVVAGCRPSDLAVPVPGQEQSLAIQEHFEERSRTELRFFGEHEAFRSPVLPVLWSEMNLPFVNDVLVSFRPDLMICFGACLIKEPLLSLMPRGRFINCHLGLSPFYRGSGTNFWPLVNAEPEYIGATLMHIDAGVDTGDIIAQVRPQITSEDNVHTLGCKTIQEAVACLIRGMDLIRQGRDLPRVKQWPVENAKVYRSRDFDENALSRYRDNLTRGLLADHVKAGGREIKLVSLDELPETKTQSKETI